MPFCVDRRDLRQATSFLVRGAFALSDAQLHAYSTVDRGSGLDGSGPGHACSRPSMSTRLVAGMPTSQLAAQPARGTPGTLSVHLGIGVATHGEGLPIRSEGRPGEAGSGAEVLRREVPFRDLQRALA